MFKKTITAIGLAMALSQPVQAGNDIDKLIAGIIVGAAIADSLSDNHHSHRPHVDLPRHNPYNDPSKPGYARGFDNPSKVCTTRAEYTHRWIIVREYNCYNELIGVRQRPRY